MYIHARGRVWSLLQQCVAACCSVLQCVAAYLRAMSEACMGAMISRLLKMSGLFCKRALSKSLYSAKETYHFKEPTNRSPPYLNSQLLSQHTTT